MQKLSSPNFPLTRNLVPILQQRSVWGAAAAISLLLIVTGMWILLFMVLPAVLLLALIHLSPDLSFKNFCKDVWLDDDGFLLQVKEEQVRISFAQIEKITWHGSNNPPRAKLWLNTATPHGSLYTFVPDLAGGRHQAKRNIESLNAKLAPNSQS
ncbi:MAG: hypothetical protein KDA57_10450 [Planctomycetales bacterium]|nr:hypothetical protein [Planctomycetales bacterium]